MQKIPCIKKIFSQISYDFVQIIKMTSWKNRSCVNVEKNPLMKIFHLKFLSRRIFSRENSFNILLKENTIKKHTYVSLLDMGKGFILKNILQQKLYYFF